MVIYEHPHAAAVDDCFDALEYVRKKTNFLKINQNLIFSAGVISSNRVLHFGLSSISMSIPQEYGDSAPSLSHLLAVISSCM
jgi:hypothetical protein